MFGLNEPIRAVAEHYAARGHAALVPNLFWRSDIPGAISYDEPQHAIAWARLKALDLDVVAADMRTATDWLRAQPFSNGKVAAIGFCGGGRFAFIAATRCGVDAAVSLYGLGISQHLAEAGNARCPVQLHYGLKDQHIPREEIDAVSAGVRGQPEHRGVALSRGRALVRQSGAADLRRSGGEARGRADRRDAGAALKFYFNLDSSRSMCAFAAATASG